MALTYEWKITQIKKTTNNSVDNYTNFFVTLDDTLDDSLDDKFDDKLDWLNNKKNLEEKQIDNSHNGDNNYTTDFIHKIYFTSAKKSPLRIPILFPCK